MKTFVLSAIALPLLVTATARGEQWAQFRGPTGQGVSRSTALPTRWGGPDADNVLWETPLVGEGHASPIVWDDRVFVCTARWPDDVERRQEVIPEHHVLCFALGDGRLLWDTRIEPGAWLRDDFRSGAGGGYAAPTPVTDGRNVFVVFGSSVMAALDLDGRIAWRKEIAPHTFDVAVGTSPILYRDTLLFLHAMKVKRDSRIVGYDKSDGSTRWQTPLPETGFAHSTPLLVDVSGHPQMIVVASGIGESGRGVQSFDPSDGKPIWWCRGAGDAASAAFGEGIVYSDSGRGGPGVAIDPTGAGDVSDTHVRWRVDQVPEGIGSPVIADGLVFRLHRPNVLKCWRASDGATVYTKRLERLSSTWASPIVDAAGHLYVASAGVSYVIEVGSEGRILEVNDLGDPNHASPAVIDDKLILLGTRKIYCIGKKNQ